LAHQTLVSLTDTDMDLFGRFNSDIIERLPHLGLRKIALFCVILQVILPPYSITSASNPSTPDRFRNEHQQLHLNIS